jgi:YVTN family beta-propeller protein
MNVKIELSVCFVLLFLIAESKAQSVSFPNFESPQAHSIAISQDGERLYAINTPDYSLAVYSLENPASPTLTIEVPVGVEPVSLAERSANEVWVVNSISDSISLIDLSMGAVVETIHVGDRPGDIVFAGNPQLAFVTSMTERTVTVIDPQIRKVVETIPIPGNAPRSLLASSDGKTVWVAISRSGNQTTIVPHTIAPPPPKPTHAELSDAPPQGILVGSDDPEWKEQLGVDLSDRDVFAIDVAQRTLRGSYTGVGTTLFNLAQKPGATELWVANTEARNRVRFEPQLKGHVIDSRITRIHTGTHPNVSVIDLNPGVDYEKLPNPEARATALSQPTDVQFDRHGKFVFVASFGTDRIGIVDENGQVLARIDIDGNGGAIPETRTKRGPRSMAVHPRHDLLYVLNRLSNSISIIDTAERNVLSELSMFDPTTEAIREGRGYLFDAKLSGNGTVSCASCHVDADSDGLAWDLGDPAGNLFGNVTANAIHPMKGPLLTQTLRGLAGERNFHWRADRPGLELFNGLFESLLGGAQLADEDMEVFVEYLKSIRFGPNPNRRLDDTLPTEPNGSSAKDGEKIFLTQRDIGREGINTFRCVDCHTKPSGSGSVGFTGLIGQPMKAAQLRGLNERSVGASGTNQRVSGYGFGADGSKEDVIAFLATSHRFGKLTLQQKESLQRYLFAFPTETPPIVGFTLTVNATEATEAAGNSPRAKYVTKHLELLIAQAELGNCDLIVQGVVDQRPVGFIYDTATKHFSRDASGFDPVPLTRLLSSLSQDNSVITFLGVPSGTGKRFTIDRDRK